MRTVLDFRITPSGAAVALSNDGKLYLVPTEVGGQVTLLGELPQEGFDENETIAAVAMRTRVEGVLFAFEEGLNKYKEMLATVAASMPSPGPFPGTAPAAGAPTSTEAPVHVGTDAEPATEAGGSALVACGRTVGCNKGNHHPGECGNTVTAPEAIL